MSEWTAGARHAMRQYDLFGRVVAQKDSGKGGLAYTLKWNTDGVIEEVGTTGSQLSLYYDVLGHVTGAFTEAGVAQYDYDKTGNRSHVQVISPTGFEDVTYRYAGDSHRLTAVDNAARTYDAAGNTTRIGTRGFVYDGGGRMMQVMAGGVVEVNAATTRWVAASRLPLPTGEGAALACRAMKRRSSVMKSKMNPTVESKRQIHAVPMQN